MRQLAGVSTLLIWMLVNTTHLVIASDATSSTDDTTTAFHELRYNYTLVLNSSRYDSFAPGIVQVDTNVIPFLNEKLHSAGLDGLAGRGGHVTALNQTSVVVGDCPEVWRAKAEQKQALCALIGARLWITSSSDAKLKLLERLVLKKAQRFCQAPKKKKKTTQQQNASHFNDAQNARAMQIRYEGPVFVSAHWMLRFVGKQGKNLTHMNMGEIHVLEQELLNDFGPRHMQPQGFTLDRVTVVLQRIRQQKAPPPPDSETKRQRRERALQSASSLTFSRSWFHPTTLWTQTQRILQDINLGTGGSGGDVADQVGDLADENQDLVPGQNDSSGGDTSDSDDTSEAVMVNDVEMAVQARCTGTSCTSDNLASTLEEQGANVNSNVDPNDASDEDLLEELKDAAFDAGVADDADPFFDAVDIFTSEGASPTSPASINITDVLDVTDDVPPSPRAEEEPDEESTPGWIWVVVATCAGSILFGVMWTLLAVHHRNREILLRRELEKPKRRRRPLLHALSSGRNLLSSRRKLNTWSSRGTDVAASSRTSSEMEDDNMHHHSVPNKTLSSKHFDSTTEGAAEFLCESDNNCGNDNGDQAIAQKPDEPWTTTTAEEETFAVAPTITDNSDESSVNSSTKEDEGGDDSKTSGTQSEMIDNGDAPDEVQTSGNNDNSEEETRATKIVSEEQEVQN